MRNVNVIIGVSMGLGKELFKSLSLKEKTFGLTSKQNLTNNNIFYFPYFDINAKYNEVLSKLVFALENTNFENISIFFNSAIYDKKNDSYYDKIKILNVNFFNQMIAYECLKKKFNSKKFKLIFFSSFEVYNSKSTLNYYKVSKQMYIEEYQRLKNNKDLIVKLFIIGGIKTETYNKNILTKKRSFLRNFLASNLDISNKYIIDEAQKNTTKIYFYPARYYIINKLRLILK